MLKWLAKEKIDMKWLWLSLIAFVGMLVVNGLAGSTTLLGGVQTGGVSDIYANLFAPAGFTFSIWGVIYLLLVLFLLRAFMVIRPKKPVVKADVMNRLLKLFTITSVLNAAWLFAWQYQVMWLSVLLMIGLLLTLIKAVALLYKQKMGLGEYALVRVPFSVYLGWISVATIANVTAWLVSIGWDGFGLSDGVWTVVVLIVGAVIALTKAFSGRDPLYMVVFVWAYFGILYKHLSDSGFGAEHLEVVVALAVLMPVLITSLVQLVREHEQVAALGKSLK